MNGGKWIIVLVSIASMFLGALIVLALWVLDVVGEHRDLAQAGQVTDVQTQALVEKRYLELLGRLDKQAEQLSTQKQTDNLMTERIIHLLDRSHTHDPGPTPRVTPR